MNRALLPRPGAIPLIVLLGAVASSVAMAILFQPDADPSRCYFGTDTRAAGMSFGAALAFVWKPAKSPDRSRGGSPDLLGVIALASLMACFLSFGEFDPLLYRGGFALVALATAGLIAAAVQPRAKITQRIFTLRPLQWIGIRSYGIYLWHFPIFMLTRPHLDIPFSGAPLLALRLAATMIVAALSFRFVETPVRSGFIGRAWVAWRESRGREKFGWSFCWISSAALAGCATFALCAALLTARPPAPPAYLQSASAKSAGLAGTEISESSAALVAALQAQSLLADDARATVEVRPQGSLAAADTPKIGLPASINVVTAIGDSVLEGVGDELQHALGGTVLVDARQGRQPSATPAVAHDLRTAGKISATVILHIGNNGIFRAATFDKIMAEFAEARQVVVVNCKVPRAWESPNNEMLAAAVQHYTNAVLVDWHAASESRPEIFWKDGHHLKPSGAKFYANLIADAVKRQSGVEPPARIETVSMTRNDASIASAR